jgi:aspartyl-tRNA(Asn)/glutamyl-tRNA(Gln) amidotransferase subunit C
MAVTRKDVEHIAQLAKLSLEENEVESLTDQMNDILGYVEKLNELDTENIEPLSHPVEGNNVFREDVPIKSIASSEALKNAPSASEEFFLVPKVINN